MGLNKYKGFIGGQPLPAENVNSIDPKNIDPQTVGYLTGGTGHSALAVFQSLSSGANNGKIKINVNREVYDDVAIDLFSHLDGSYSNGSSTKALNYPRGGVFVAGVATIQILESFQFQQWESGSITITLRTGATVGSGDVLWTDTFLAAVNTHYTRTLSTPIALTEGASYNFQITGAGGGYLLADNTLRFTVYGKKRGTVVSLDDVALRVQDAIRALTNENDMVIYDTNKFKLTSGHLGRTSQILKLMTPSTGADISGAGATPYLDCAANATETLGTGEDFNLVRLNENGKLPIEILSPIRAIASDTLRASADTERSRGNTETTPTKMKEISTEYGGILRVKFEGKGQSGSQQHARIYKNGVAFGTLRTFTDATYREYSEDLLFEKGDLIQLYLWVSFSNSSYRAYGKNFRVYFDLQKGDEANTNLD